MEGVIMPTPPHQQPPLVPAGDTIEIYLDWFPAPQRLPEHTHDDFMAIKAGWCRDLTVRWQWWMDYRDMHSGRDPHVDITPATLAHAVLQLCWCPGTFRQGRRHGGFFLRSRILAFDIDDGTPYAEIRESLASVGITPFIAYHSPSSRSDHERFRVILLLDAYITRRNTYEALVGHCIRYLFGDRCDRSCTDAARVYFPGREIIEVNEPSTCLLSVDDILAAIEVRVRESDQHGNAARTIREIREACGAAEDSPSGKSGGDGGDSDESTPHDDSYISLRGVDSSSGGPSSSPAPNHPASREGPGPPQAAQGRTTSAARPLNLRGFPEVLSRHCALAHEFVAGLTADELATLTDTDADVPGWIREPELFGLMTNVAGIRGGQAWFMGTLASLPHLYGHFPKGHWEVRFRTHRANARHPERCERFCPHADTCDHADTIIATIRRPSLFRVLRRLETVSLDTARAILAHLVRELLADLTPGRVDVVHAEAGLGKTERYIQEVARLGIAVIIAAPTHRLKDQIAERLRRAGVQCLTTPEVPDLPDHLAEELKALYEVGDVDGARRWILDHQSTVPELKAYVHDLETALASDGTVVTTHARLLQVLDQMGDARPIIIDEDPLKCLRPCGSVPLSDLRRLQEHMGSVGAAGAPALAEFVALLDGLPAGTTIDTPAGLLQRVAPVAHLAAAGIASRVICLLGSQHVLVSGEETMVAHHCGSRTIPANRRIILFSATASEAIYSRVFGPAMRYHEVPLAAATGNIIQVMGRTYSRTDLRRRGLPDLPEGYRFIGFKANLDDFGDDAIGHFGAIEGLDDYGGQNIAVVGTPHMREETYNLLAHALGRIGRGMERMSYRTVEHGGMEFRFMTYRDELLRTVQFHLIQSELEQAVGRARVLTEDCTVRLYSNFPLRRARHEV